MPTEAVKALRASAPSATRIVAVTFVVASLALLLLPVLDAAGVPLLIAVPALAAAVAASVLLALRFRYDRGRSDAAVVGHTPVAVARTALAERQAIDALTGTLTQRAITARLLESMAVAERYGRRLSVAIVSVNDSSNTLAPTMPPTRALLPEVADALSQALRTPDRIGRYSNNRFLVVMPETELADAQRTAARLRNTVMRLHHADHPPVELRIGLTQHRRSEDIQHLLTRLEAALGAAAHSGGIAALSAA